MTDDTVTTEDLVEQLMRTTTSAVGVVTSLPHDTAMEVIERLKQEADRHWSINANRSLEIADLIVMLGQARTHPSIVALGLMARGDALKLLGRNHEAWDALEESGRVYLEVGDEVGWARTRLGRLWVGNNLGRLSDALGDIETARQILEQHGQPLRVVTLDLNMAAVHHLLGHYDDAIRLYLQARVGCDALGSESDSHRGAIAANLGMVYTTKGDLRQALRYQQEALAIFEARGDHSDAADARLNLSDIYVQQGLYPQALKLLYEVRAFYKEAALPRHAAEAGRSVAEANLHLNRYDEAQVAAREALDAFRTFDASFGQAQTLLLLGTAEAYRQQLDTAREHLAEAARTFELLDAPAWAAVAELGQAQVALAQGDLAQSESWAVTAGAQLAGAGLEIYASEAKLVRARVALERGEHARAGAFIRAALVTARRCGVPTLRYSVLVLWGRLWAARGNIVTAIRANNVASRVIERVDRDLTITLRPGFLHSRREASNRLLEFSILLGRDEQAWIGLERTKAHVLAGYLRARGAMHWHQIDEHGSSLREELEELRAEQYRLLQQVTNLPENPGYQDGTDRRAVHNSLHLCEHRIRTLSEQLHLYAGTGEMSGIDRLPTVEDVCAKLDDGTLLLEYGGDGERLWAFVLDRQGLRVTPLDVSTRQVTQTIEQLHANINSALRLGPERAGQGLHSVARMLLQRLDGWLRRDLPVRWADYDRVVVVPYGALHYLPFHLLHDGTTHLLARHEISVLPAAALVAQVHALPSRSIRALALAHSDDGRLPATLDEARMVAMTFPGAYFVEDEAKRSMLQDAGQYTILHLAAHGEHRPDAPEFSFIRLADGLLQADDLFQLDLGCSLVVLSACETGRALVAPGDDLIGLGRGLLYAGARSLVLSQWRADDATTLAIMKRFYAELARGTPKSAALRAAQSAFAVDGGHPAFWGSFQLVGEGGAL